MALVELGEGPAQEEQDGARAEGDVLPHLAELWEDTGRDLRVAVVGQWLGCGVRVQGCIRRDGTSEAAQEAVGQANGRSCQSGWGRLLSVTNAIETCTCRQGDSGWA